MPTVGEQLASAREAKEWSLEDVARLTKLRSDQVLALEEGRYHIFSAPVYVRGFVKSYAKLVNLDPVPLVEQLNGEINKDKKLQQADPLRAPQRGFIEWCAYALSRVPWKIVLPLRSCAADHHPWPPVPVAAHSEWTKREQGQTVLRVIASIG